MRGVFGPVLWLALLVEFAPLLCGRAWASHDPSVDLKVESLEANPGNGVHLKLTAIPLIEAPSLEISCEAPWALSVDSVSDRWVPTVETSGTQRIRLWKGTLKKGRSKAVDFWIQAPDLESHEAILTATVTFPNSDWQLANAVSIRLEQGRVSAQSLLPSKSSVHNSSFRGPRPEKSDDFESAESEPIREIEVETQNIR